MRSLLSIARGPKADATGFGPFIAAFKNTIRLSRIGSTRNSNVEQHQAVSYRRGGQTAVALGHIAIDVFSKVSRESAPDEEDRTRHQRRILETIRRLLFVIPISEPAVYCRLVGLLRSTEVTQEVRGKISMYIWHYDEHFHIGVAREEIL